MAILSVAPLFLALSGAALADCGQPAALVEQVEQAVLDARFEEARATTDLAEAAFGCTGSADSALLARIWIAEGAMAHIEGDAASRDQAFASAQRIAPGAWTEAFGDDLEALWRSAADIDSGTGQLDLEGLTEGQVAMVDGQPVAVPALLASGLYLVQADDDGGPPAFARIVLVPSDQTLVVRVDQDNVDSAQIVMEKPDRKGKWVWFAGAGAAAALAGTSALLANGQDGAMDSAATMAELDGAYGRQKGFTYASYGLAGLGVACVGVGIAW